MTPLFLTAPGEERLDLFLSRELGITRSAVQKLLEEGAVALPGEIPKKNRRTSPGEVYSVVLPEPEPAEAIPQEIPLEVVYEDGDVIVVNKPVGMVVHPAPGHPDGTLVNGYITAAIPSPASTASCAPASSTASTGTPPA